MLFFHSVEQVARRDEEDISFCTEQRSNVRRKTLVINSKQSTMTHEKYRYQNKRKIPFFLIFGFFSVMQTDSEYESDVSSITDSSTTDKIQYEHLVKRLDSLTQENRVLQIELQTYKLRLKSSQQEIKQLKQFVFIPISSTDLFIFVVKVFICK